jgi:hypothetical protein
MDSGSEPGMTKGCHPEAARFLRDGERARFPVIPALAPICHPGRRAGIQFLYFPLHSNQSLRPNSKPIIPASGRQIEQQSKRSVDYNETFAEIL